MELGLVTTVITLIQTVLPLLGGATAGAPAIAAVIGTLEKFMPLIVQFVGAVPTLYTGVKNIISALKSDPSTLPDQLKALQAFDVQVDAAFEAAAADVDPDAPGAV